MDLNRSTESGALRLREFMSQLKVGRFVALGVACMMAFVTLGSTAVQAQTVQAGISQDSETTPPANSAAIRSIIVNPSTAVGAAPGSPSALARQDEKSVGLSFLASAVLPGAGQALNGQRIKAGVALAIEAALVTGFVVTRQNGLDAESDFQDFAHARWSPTRYATWLNDYREWLIEDFSANVSAPPVDVISGINFMDPGSWSGADRAAVQGMIDQITAIERQVFHPETGAAFSHQLPDFADQQYYELIGKYFQFAPGWDDYPAWRASDDSFTDAIDPERTGADGGKPNVSQTFYRYAEDHADAQDMLRKASRISLLFIANHLVAAIDAAVSAKLHNDRMLANSTVGSVLQRLDPTMGLAWNPDGSPVPVARLRVSLSRP